MRIARQSACLCVVVLCVILISSTVFGAKKTPSTQKIDMNAAIDECNSLVEQAHAALNADDWPHAERLVKKYLNQCKGVHSSLNIANAYGDLSFTYLHMRKYKAALEASNQGIEANYAIPTCHVNKTDVLCFLNKLKEARAQSIIAERVTKDALERAQKERSKPYNTNLDNEHQDSLISLYTSQLTHLHELQKALGMTLDSDASLSEPSPYNPTLPKE